MQTMKRAQEPSNREPIAIVGIGCRFPGDANDPDSFWDLLCRGVDAIREVPESRWNVKEYYHQVPGTPGKTYSKWGGFVNDIEAFEPDCFSISPREAAQVDPQQRMLLEVSWEALEDANLPVTSLSGSNAGVFVGISTTDYSHLQTTPDSTRRVDGYSATGGAASIAANRISYCLNLLGPSVAVDTACSSALVATHLACSSIWNNECDLALAGGVNAIFSPNAYIAFCAANMLSPVGRCKAFDASADGFVRAEGAGVVVLQRLSRALADHSPIYATIAGSGINQDGRTSGIALPSQKAQETLIRAICEQTGIRPAHVDYVEAHGTGTPAGDPIEANSLGRALSSNRGAGESCCIGSVKTNIGHLEAAAGIAGLIKAALAVKHRQIPPSLHFNTPNPNIAFADLKLRVPTKLEEWPQKSRPATAAVNSFGFGGTNAHVLLVEHEEGREAGRPADDASGPWLLPLSARSPEALGQLVRSYQTFTAGNGRVPVNSLRDICFTASVGRSHLEHRLALVVRDHEELAERCAAYLREESRPGVVTGRSSTGQEPKLAFIFSGQGPQWWGMGRQLLEREPIFRATLEKCDALLSQHADWSLLAELSKDEKSSRIQETAIAQPALFALQVGLRELWKSWGIEPQAVIGHSVGEVAAAYTAGALSLPAAVKVIFYRGHCMDTASSLGRMLAVGLSPDAAMDALRGHEDRVSLAAINGSESVTLSGDPEALERIATSLVEREVFCRFLQVNYAFHSPQMAPVEERLLSALDGLEVSRTSLPMISTVTGGFVEGNELGGHYWWENVRRTVQFASALKELARDGYNTFVELSPHPVLAGSVHELLAADDRNGHVLPSLRREGDESAQMLAALGGLYTVGFPMDWERIWPRAGVRVSIPKYPWRRQRYWAESEGDRKARLHAVRHPLLGRKRSAPHPLWENKLDKQLLPFLEDHRVQGHAVFPAAGYVEMALGAAGELFGEGMVRIEEMQIQKALFLPDDGEAPATQLVFNPADASFEIHSRANQADTEWILHTSGYLRVLEDRDSAPPVDPAALKAQLEVVPVDQCYQTFADAGLNYGPTFQGIKGLWRAEGQALGQLELAADCQGQAESYRVHPALLDSCFQVLLGALPRTDKGAIESLYLPVQIERVSVFARPRTRVWGHVQLQQFNANGLLGDIRVYDEQGTPLVAITGFRCQAVGRGSSREVPPEWFHEVRWYEKPWPEISCGPGVGISIPATQEIVRSAVGQIAKIDAELGWSNAWLRGEVALNRVATEYLWQALVNLGQPCQPGDVISLRTLIDDRKVLPRYERVLTRFILALEHTQGLTRSNNGEWRVTREGPSHAAQATWQNVLALNPALLPELTLINRFGSHLHEVLRGERDAVELLFPGGSTVSAEQVYEDPVTFRLYNATFKLCMQRVIEALPAGRRIRILEIGAGTGGITSRIIPMLPPRQTEYVFTDVTNVFLLKAEQKFRSYPFVEFKTLDIEQDPLPQGLEAGSFDIVLAAQVLHATRDLRATLHNISKLMVPRGLLLFLELEEALLYTDMVFGLMEGWWRFSDFQLRPDYPLIDGSKWTKLLADVGFDDIDKVSLGIGAQSEQVVLLARAPDGQEDVPEDVPRDLGKGQWLVLADRGGLGERLGAQFSKWGGSVVLVDRVESFRQVDHQHYEVNPANPEDLEKLCRAIEHPEGLAGVVHLWSLDTTLAAETTLDSLQHAERIGCHALVQLVQTLEKLELWGTSCQLLCVTRNAQPVGSALGSMSVAQSSLLGLGRVIINEHPNVDCKLIDLGWGDDPAADVRDLLRELQTHDEEREVALRDGVRFIPRVELFSDQTRIAPATNHADARFQLTIPNPGALDRMRCGEVEASVVGLGELEVEVVSAALNFRDVMKVLGFYPTDSPDATIVGDEFAGKVTRVGEGVTDFAAGDEVIGVAPGSFASHVVAPARLVTPKPEHLTFDEAVTTPVVFLTAYYALVHLARLNRGETVLIHAAAGGVGLAAVQIAQHLGAHVLATAGSPEKRDLLLQLGAQHVMDSRSLAFADQVMEQTGGRGVDVVLNSLAGQAIAKGISCLAPYGRFLELGKRDIYQNSKLGLWDFRKNLSYFAIDLGRLFEDKPELVQTLLQEFSDLLGKQTFHPLPHRVFPISRSLDAFRYLAQAKHVGKVVLSLRDPDLVVERSSQRKVEFSSSATYLITGGFGGYGLTVASWCVDRGARNLVLMGRHGAASDEAKQLMLELADRGVRVLEAKADVTNPVQVAEVFENIDQTMPPLRGVFHMAMVLDDGVVLRLNPDRFTRVTGPKIAGAWNLHLGTLHRDLDFFVSFSSFSSVGGNFGQGNYAAANSFLDALAHYRRACGLPASTINWGVLKEVGYVARKDQVSQLLRWVEGFSPAEAMAALAHGLHENPAQVLIGKANWAEWSNAIPRRDMRLSYVVSEAIIAPGDDEGSSGIRDALKNAAEGERRELLEGYVRTQVARVLGSTSEKLALDRPLNEMGMDSLMGVELKNRLEKDLAMSLPASELMQGPSITKLTTSVMNRLGFSSGTITAAQRDTTKENPLLVPLQQGTGSTALFCIHPAGGQVAVYRQLVERLPENLPVFGIQSRVFATHEKEYQTIVAMAEQYANAIRSQQPRGPYHLFGFSVGGFIAVAIAHALECDGETVKFVALADCDLSWTDPELPRVLIMRNLILEIQALFDAEDASDGTHPSVPLTDGEDVLQLVERLISSSAEERVEATLTWLRESQTKVKAFAPDELRSLIAAFDVHLQMMLDSERRIITAPILIWRARERFLKDYQSETTWASWTKAGVIESVIEGGHYQLMAMPAVDRIATELWERWQAFDAGQMRAESEPPTES